MLTSLLRLGKGYVRIRLKGYSPERFLNLSYEMSMSISDFRRLRPMLRKTHSRMELLERHGLPFFLFRYRKRKMFFAGILFAAAIL